ncbi:MAG: prefoldin subunit alpha [Candidatus Micrarchaeota archaeon]
MENDEQLSRLAYEARVYQSQLAQMRQQAGSAQNAIFELDSAVAGINALADAKKDTLMGIGAGVFARATVTGTEKVLVEVGAGVFVEKPAAAAAELLESRKKNLESALKKLAESADAVNRRLSLVEEKASALQQG